MPKISFQHVDKYFYLQHQKTLKELLQALFVKQKTLERVHALRNVSFNIGPGETVGIIGKNSAGKSTLLKLIAGVSFATTGKVNVSGRIAPLIELGAGFHPELTGKENIFLNGVILGMDEQYLIEKFEDIVAFSEIDNSFIYSPVKYYSSGMYMRLAFSVAVFMNPDILLVDEILAVGDKAFRDKCLAKMNEFKKNGVTTIYVSHSMDSVEAFCDRVLYLKKGELLYDGKPKDGIKQYLAEKS
ncbi:MAG TPA: ABC transporter ATP-binding protein [Candidatus Woesebacteria bacterium]|nr:ABC transporter ATP-binding protein [Candidatus Woesebacteria bacterium]